MRRGWTYAVRNMTLSRGWNALLVWSSYHLSRYLKKPLVWGRPISLSIEPTTACNLRCPECPSGLRSFTRPTGNLDQHLFARIIDQVAQHTMYLTFYFQGEPYIHPNFLNMVQLAASKRMFTATSTNAHFLTPENADKTVKSGLDRLIISIDGTDQGTYAAYRREGQLDKVIAGTKNIIESKKRLGSSTPEVVFQFLVVRPNEHQVEEVKQLGDELGVDRVALKTAQIYDFENGNELIPTIDRYSRYRKLADGRYRIKNKLLNQCWRMWQSTVITWDGKVVPCCFDKDAAHEMGNVSTQPFDTIWKNEPYMNFRQALLRSRSEIEICKNCSEGTRVWDRD